MNLECYFRHGSALQEANDLQLITPQFLIVDAGSPEQAAYLRFHRDNKLEK